MTDANMFDDDTDLIRAFPEAFEPYRMAIRIAALEAQIARLTAPVEFDEAMEIWAGMPAEVGDLIRIAGLRPALTAFLERRIKG